MKLFSHEVVQKQWADIDYRENMSLIGLMRNRGHKEIMAIGSYAKFTDDLAEVAFVVREDFQGMGVGSHLLSVLEEIARKNRYKGFSAAILPENISMLHVFKKRYPHANVVSTGTDIELTMMFEIS